MKICEFKYSKEWPVPFSDDFFRYVNTAIQGEQIFFEYENCFIPLILKKKYIFKIGYFIHPPMKNGQKLSLQEEKVFFEKLIAFLKDKKTLDFIMPPIHIEVFQQIPMKSLEYKLGIIRLSLKNKTEEEVFFSFKPIYRNLIRKALKEEVIMKFGMEYFDDFYQLYQEKLKQENSPFDSYDQIKKIATSLEKTNSMTCGVAYVNGKPDAGIVNIHDAKNAYYLWAGTATDAHPGSLRLLHWEIIQNYVKLGIENYRMGAARQGDHLNEKHARLRAFKLGFGSVIDEGYHFILVINSLKYKLYNLLINLKTKIKK